MAVLTGNEYRESLKEFQPEIYVRGEKVDKVWEHPLLKQTVNHIAAGWELASSPEANGKYTAWSQLAGQEVPRLQLHIQTSLEDATSKAGLTREISSSRICAGCVMSNGISVTWAMIYDLGSSPRN